MAAGGLRVRKIKRLVFRKHKSRLATGFCEHFISCWFITPFSWCSKG